jgi:hypothetical protein
MGVEMTLTQLLWTALGIAIILAICSGLLRARLVAKSWIPNSVAQAERTELLEAIKDAATEPQMEITLSGFWHGRGWSRLERHYLLSALIDRRILHRVQSGDTFTALMENIAFNVFCQPPSKVILNTRDWTRMATDQSGQMPDIIIGSISGGQNHFGPGGLMTQTNHGSAVNDIERLVEALRADAARLEPVSASTIRRTAVELEDEARAGRWDRVTNIVKRVTGIVAASDGLFEASRHVIETTFE